ncbi:hypothetical protein [Caballeronia arvi]|uniref:hypothetical protein n=1 Tax=Caballeronia arvi TaxID=1777135 RepID=UPI00190E64CF|nr:hypothetical protein [Caballeronia arvi]
MRHLRKVTHAEVWEYPDGRVQLRAAERLLPYREYDRLTEVDQGAIVEHKRLSHALELAEMMQAQRDDRSISGSPSRTNRGVKVRSPKRVPGTKESREFTRDDLEQMIGQLSQQHAAAAESGTKANHRSGKAR